MKRRTKPPHKGTSKRHKMDHNFGTKEDQFPLLSLPNDLITVVGEKFDKINDILNFDRTCRKIHNIIDSPSFWKRLIDIWFGPSQLLIDAFGNNTHSSQYQYELLSKSGLFDRQADFRLWQKKQFKDKVKIKFIFHSYFVNLRDTIRQHITEACRTKRTEEYEAQPIPHEPPVTLEKINCCPEQFKSWKFKFNAFDQEWSGYAMLYTNGEWIITPVPVTIQQIDHIYDNFAIYIKDGGLAELVVPKDKMDDIDHYTKNFVQIWSTHCFWPFQMGPNNVQYIHPNLVFVFYGVHHHYLFQVYPLTNQEKANIFHVEDYEWRPINL